jgi:pimeloyl-ACP methyl ester carboxylesterase
VLEPPAAGRLHEIRVPTLAIVGDLDVRGVLHATDLVATSVPGAGKAIVTGTAHMLTMERPHEFETIVLDFLASVPV